MNDRTTLWLAAFAALLAAIAMVLGIARHGFDDLTGLIGPALIIFLMIIIAGRHRGGAR